MKQNITLSLDKELIKRARVLAAQRQMSVSQMLGRELRTIVEDADYHEWAKRKALAELRKGFHLGGKVIATREELHER